MSDLITASVSENFELTVASSDGFTGEHNAEALEINISSLLTGEYDYYVLVFDDLSVSGVMKSNEIRSAEDYPAYLNGETIVCPLSSQLTSTGRLKFQLEAHKVTESGSITKKTSVALLEFKPSIMSGNDIRFDTSTLSRLDDIEKRLYDAEASIEELSVIPLATTESIGGIKLFAHSPIQLNEKGETILNLSKIQESNFAAKIITTFLQTSSKTKCIYQNNCEEDTRTLLNTTARLSQGFLDYVIFYSEVGGTLPYRDGNSAKQNLTVQSGIIYQFKGQGSEFAITEYTKYNFFELLTKGVK